MGFARALGHFCHQSCQGTWWPGIWSRSDLFAHPESLKKKALEATYEYSTFWGVVWLSGLVWMILQLIYPKTQLWKYLLYGRISTSEHKQGELRRTKHWMAAIILSNQIPTLPGPCLWGRNLPSNLIQISRQYSRLIWFDCIVSMSVWANYWIDLQYIILVYEIWLDMLRCCLLPASSKSNPAFDARLFYYPLWLVMTLE